MVKQAKTSESSKPKLWPLITMAFGAAFLFVIANSALWVNRYVFNTENFTQVTTQSLTSESSRQAMAQAITNEALKDYPTVKNVINNSAVNIISGVLGSDQVETVLQKATSRLQVALTSNNQESIVINLEGPKSVLTQVIDIVGQRREVKVNPDNIPSEIVLLDADKIPDFYKYGLFFLWLGPIALIGAAILSALPYFKLRQNYRMIMLVQGGALTLAGLLTLLAGPLFKPPLLASLNRQEGRTVIGNLYDAFMATFTAQTSALIIAGLLVMVAAGGLMTYEALKQKNRQTR